MFPDNEETAKLDLIIIEGDVYDHDLYLYSPDEALFRPFRKYLLTLAKKYDIVVRVLRGTPDHDWDQSRSFVTDNELMEIHADCKYVDTVEIEYLERFNMHILYIPDEFMPRCEDTWGVVKAALKRHNLDKVDFCVMHGCFPHQLPDLEGKIQMHDPVAYSDITNYYIVIGHIHQPSQNGKIIGPGSIERLVHGDEGTKGYVRITIDLINRNDKIEFVENKYATPYRTLDMRGMSGDQVRDKVEIALNRYRSHDNINLRILASPTDPATAMFKQLQNMYPEAKWRYKSADDRKSNSQLVTVLTDDRMALTRPALTPDNIVEVLAARVAKRNPELVSVCTQCLKDMINGNN